MKTFADSQLEASAIAYIASDDPEGQLLLTRLTPRSFLVPLYREMFCIMQSLAYDNIPINAAHIMRNISRSKADRVLETLDAGCAFDLDYLVAELERLAGYQKFHDALVDADKKMDPGNIAKLDEEFSSILGSLFDASTSVDEKSGKTTSQILTEAPFSDKIARYEELKAKGEQPFFGHKTGFLDIDSHISGMGAGHLVIIGARPSVGKTTLALNIMVNNPNLKSAFFSLEMTADQLIEKLVLSNACVNADLVQKGLLSDQQKRKIDQGAKKIADSPFFIDDCPRLSPSDIYLRSKQAQSKLKGLDIIYVDYIGLMSGNQKQYESNQVKVADISRALKEVAKKLEVPIVVLAQLNREIEQNKRAPRLSDLRESGSIEADADIVMLLDKDDVIDGMLHVHIRKNRFGPVTTKEIKLVWEKAYGRMFNFSEEDSRGQSNHMGEDDPFRPFSPQY